MKEKPFNSEQLAYLEELLKSQETHLESKLSSFCVNDLDIQSVFRLERGRLKIAYRLLGLMSVIALILAIVLISLLPLQKTEHHFVDFLNQDKHYAIIQRADKSISNNEALVRSLIGAYVLNRESINRIDDKSRYELVRLQSNAKVWQRFEDLIKTKNSIYAQSHLEREVHIINIAIYHQDNNPIASVSIVAKLMNENKLVYEKRFKIVLSYMFDTPDFDYTSMPKNPTGFKITRYSITEITPTNRND
ncbi:type IV secretion system protein [Helicobacter cetorum]|uniref:type IV secretion system protein n=1 Tax=Helicobacter cetorum TaxID=138563 RepID=UPI000CF036C7|nr:virB8 family protein [Helicobacter cetorum]